MNIVSSFNVAERREAKRISRENDVSRLNDGSVNIVDLQNRNGFFSSLDRSKARITVRRAYVNLGASHR
jgi:hypothetical protein